MFAVDDLDFNFEESFEDPSKEDAKTSPQRDAPCQNKTFRSPLDTSLLTSTPIQTYSRRNASKPFEHSPFSRNNENVCNKQTVVRKFPGPAGLLPDKPPRSFEDSSLLLHNTEEEQEGKKCDTILCSQASENAFSEPPFKRLKKDFDIDRKNSPFCDYTVEWLKKKAVGKGLTGRKVPFLAVVLQSVDCSSADPVLSLRDPTGELSGTLHREVWKEMSDYFKPGAAIVLKQVGVFSTGTSRRKVLVNITINNIVTVYCPSEEGQVIVKHVQPTTTADLVKYIGEWNAQAQNSPARIPVIQNKQELFQSVSSINPANSPMLRNNSEVNRLYASVSSAKAQNNMVRSNFDLNLDESDFAELEEAMSSKDVTNARSTKPNQNNSQSSNFDVLFDVDDQFEEAMVSQIEVTARKGSVSEKTDTAIFRKPLASSVSTSFVPKVLMSKNTSSILSKSELPKSLSKTKFEICSQTVLSDVESSQIDDVLSGVDLDDF